MRRNPKTPPAPPEATITRTYEITINTRDANGHLQAVPATIDVTVNLALLADTLGITAARSPRRTTTALYGAVKVAAR